VRRVVVRSEAESEAADAYEWYESRQQGLGERFIATVRDVVAQVGETPTAFPVIEKGARRARVFGFPYSVYFEVFDETVVVLAIFHGRRSPRRWRERA
jgi:toxin ParE1/3/4